VSSQVARATPKEVAKKLRNQRLAALKGRGFSRASHRFQWFTAWLESRALSKLRRPEFFRKL